MQPEGSYLAVLCRDFLSVEERIGRKPFLAAELEKQIVPFSYLLVMEEKNTSDVF